jgi:hypothetical protein
VLTPGEFREGIGALGFVAERRITGGDLVNEAFVSFDGAAPIQYMRFEALAQCRVPIVGVCVVTQPSASLVALYYVYFCVPRPGQTTCDSPALPAAGDVSVTASFGVGYLGRVLTNGINPSAELRLDAAIVESSGTRERFVAVQQILDVNAGSLLPGTQEIYGLPVPIPELDDIETQRPLTLTATLRRGQIYRFQLRVTARARSGPLPGGIGRVNFAERFLRRPSGSLLDVLSPPGFVMLHNLSLSVSSGTTDPTELIASLRAVVASLQEQLGGLSERVGSVETRLQGSINGVQLQQAETSARATALERRSDDLEATTNELHRSVRDLQSASGSRLSGPRASIDAPAADATVAQPLHLGGWAIDLDATVGTGISTLHVWAYPVSGGPPQFVGVATVGSRPDIAAKFGPQFRESGFGLAIEGLRPGTYDLAVFPWSTVRGDFVEAVVRRVTIRP